MQIEPISAVDQVSALLVENELPVADISAASPVQFFGMFDGGALLSVVGLELYPPFGLLRSLAVRSSWRQRGLAHQLVSFAESYAAAHGVASLFLLTTTASEFFLRLGYSVASRDNAPIVIQRTAQFSGLCCPASSAFLTKRFCLAAESADR